ncbi:MAG: ATP-binding cassette domain-containing protein, partial [Spirochaetales bacterium]|nr:ATP-binding cassette domain-containing protein [Spirochaetales bacterium]
NFPLGALICVTGVSGSGKSTLVRDVLYKDLSSVLRNEKEKAAVALSGYKPITRVLEVDQTPIGRTPRSCPATYSGIWTTIRQLFAETPEARLRGYSASRFSFNVEGGRCEECGGQGIKRIEMSFLPDVHVECGLCGGRRFNAETLAAVFKEKSIAEILEMSVDEAVKFFSFLPKVYNTLKLLQDIGLGYVTLGQQSPTLSGGEAQRIKLAAEVSKTALYTPSDGKHTLYVLDEPTVGLHMADVVKLIYVLKKLVIAGNTVVIVEHNLDVIAEADWIIDLGPEGGDDGGRVVSSGPVGSILTSTGHTAAHLRAFLEGRS